MSCRDWDISLKDAIKACYLPVVLEDDYSSLVLHVNKKCVIDLPFHFRSDSSYLGCCKLFWRAWSSRISVAGAGGQLQGGSQFRSRLQLQILGPMDSR